AFGVGWAKARATDALYPRADRSAVPTRQTRSIVIATAWARRCNCSRGEAVHVARAFAHPTKLSISGAAEAVSNDLTQDAAPDRLVGERRIGPPPAILLHRLGGPDEPLGHRLEVRVREVEAEDQARGADPAQGQPLGPQVILQHPTVARRLGVG